LLAVDFTLGRVHDVENQLRLSAFTSASVKVGATATYTRSFGPPITPDRLLSSASITLRAQRLKGEFFAEDGAPARDESRLSVSVGVGQSDKLFVFEPQRARSLGVGGTLTVTRRDAVPAGAGGPAQGAEYLLAGVVSAGWTAIATPRAGHTFAVDASAAAAVGDIEARSQLIGVSGAEGLRGYAPSELFARAAALVRGEYRHVFVHDLAWNLGHYNFVRGIGGVAFVDAGALSPCESYDLASADAVYASAGYGLRFFYDSFGTLPQMMRLDVAVRLPVGARDRLCLGDPSSGGPPVMVYLGFLPPF
ncbi:MAG: hypothetical protein JW940_05380, partial [Polyangiaceae bacterium]|nr:hypothetical protein [Polyangiaceae bacterium]